MNKTENYTELFIKIQPSYLKKILVLFYIFCFYLAKPNLIFLFSFNTSKNGTHKNISHSDGGVIIINTWCYNKYRKKFKCCITETKEMIRY